MIKEKSKFEFVSDEWVEQARMILKDLVSEFGKETVNFSVCETFTNAPKKIDPSGIVSWCFYIKGNSVKVARGKADDTDVKINFDYQKASNIAKIVYNEEIIARQKEDIEKAREALAIAGKEFKEPPDYLTELHNQLALVTV